MSENRLKGYFEKMKQLLEIIAVIITIISGALAITTYVYIPTSVAFEVVKYFFLIMVPITVSMILLRFRLRETPTLPNLEQKIGRLDERMDKIETDIGTIQSYFTFKCPNCLKPMFLPILPSMVMRTETHEKDGSPSGFKGNPEYEIGCPSCQKTWHIVYRK
jgi:hypothetical protein